MKAEIKTFDHVVLQDGREGAVIEAQGPDYLVDVGNSPTDLETVRVEPWEIVRVVENEYII